ncbi:GlcG protein [Marinobacterium aestuarii]|uniref:GlcG protein n=1 Tax=Marinobacterium aestuarii TaxID=1821621 RepID=A0A1A9F3G3_9GAMM|nr:heme-binding protein [Marinobacterium aestuarii]ANG64747.1 GlcG protein [Marinobacterium aestuarii]
MSTVNLATALSISAAALSKGRELGAAPLTVAVLDQAGRVVSLQREDGSSLLRPEIATAKAWGSLALGKPSRLIAADAENRPAFIGAVNSLAQGNIIPVAGGVLVRDDAGVIVGAVGISGDTSDVDELCAMAGVAVSGLRGDNGV